MDRSRQELVRTVMPAVEPPVSASMYMPAPPQPSPSDGGLGIRAGLRIIRRQLPLIGGITAIMVALVVAYSMWTRPVYEVTAMLGVDEKRAPVPDVYQSLSLQENAVSTEMEVLQSRSLASDVVDDYALSLTVKSPRRASRASLFSMIVLDTSPEEADYRLTRIANGRVVLEDRTHARRLGEYNANDVIRFPGGIARLAPTAALEPQINFSITGHEAAVEAFRKQVKVDRPVRDANVITVAYRGTDPALSRDVLNSLVDRFIRSRHTVQKTEARSAVRFLKKQLDTLSRQLAVADDSLRSYREQEQIVRLDEQANTEVSRLVSAQADRNSLNAERSSLSSLLKEIDTSPHRDNDQSRYRRLVAFPSLLKNTTSSELLQQLSTLEDQRAALLSRRTPQDPEVQSLTMRIQAVDSGIRMLAATYLDGLDRNVAALDQNLNAYSGSLKQIPHKEVEYARLDRSTRVLGEAFQLLQTRLKEAEIAQAVEDPSVRVIDPATLPVRPLRPNIPVNVAIGLFLGLMLGLAAAFMRNGVDRTVRTRADIRHATGLPVLGIIPSMESVRRMTRRREKHTRLPSLMTRAALLPASSYNQEVADIVAGGIVADAYARLDANIAQLDGVTSGKILIITSAMAGDGKSTSATNLSLTLAKRGRKILLIDADMRNSRLGAMLNEAASWGLSDLLVGHVNLDAVIHHLSRGEGVWLDYISAGTLRRDPTTLLASEGCRNFLTEMSVVYDLVIIDTPPLIVPDAVVLSQRADSVLVVVRAGETSRAALEYAMQQLRVIDAPVVGAVLNDIDFQRDDSYDEAFGYYGSAYSNCYVVAQGAPV